MVGSVEGRGYLPRTIQHPARLVPLAFIVTILFGTGLLMLPISRAEPAGLRLSRPCLPPRQPYA
jgi:hypothetical protein